MAEVDQRIALAREYLRAAYDRNPDHMPPSRLIAEVAETRRQLAQVLAAATELAAAAAVLPSDAERATALAEAMTADPALPGGWTAEGVISAALGRGLAAMEAQYLGGDR
ncbi:MAG TPA: hypothetical protein VGF54_07350 [Streptosporangiaceae bacterium]|jgi:hypothetical protein